MIRFKDLDPQNHVTYFIPGDELTNDIWHMQFYLSLWPQNVSIQMPKRRSHSVSSTLLTRWWHWSQISSLCYVLLGKVPFSLFGPRVPRLKKPTVSGSIWRHCICQELASPFSFSFFILPLKLILPLSRTIFLFWQDCISGNNTLEYKNGGGHCILQRSNMWFSIEYISI